ncbi:hypothetical protein LTR84_009027 [Exophiala bonariae]|uniref:Uncharacterized protein n=1 Tax=Exophiala bonariae TaxID=1690606 RepID=A0AAV9MVK2_9EURO|nr:hypothetical protein LTR84_009027 [Exophiala bonariae]
MAATVGPLLNGNMPVVRHLNEALEYEKILKLRDEVFAGNHPRLTVPAHAVQHPSAQSQSQSSSQSYLNIPPTYPPSASQTHSANLQSKREEEATRSQKQLNGGFTTSTQPASNVSEFDPVLLTKSDDLVRAETQLKRQRLEKALKDQFEQKRLDARKKPAPAEAKPDFDLQAMLTKASDIVKPSSAKDDADASDSLDENSFYSSRAPDSVQDGPSSSGGEEDGEADQTSGPRVSAVMGEPLQMDDDADALAYIRHSPPRIPDPIKHNVPVDHAIMDLDDEEEEGEYSPPEATEQYPTNSNTLPGAMQDSRDPRGRPLRRYSEAGDNGRRAASPAEANMRIVRNHITSPIAPQPSRVSPLAVAKDQPFSQNGRQMRTRRAQQQGSPPSPDDSQSLPARKKRKVERPRRTRRNGGLSPDAFIKEENVSPPPFHDVQPLGSGRPRPAASERPIIVEDDEPVQQIRYMPPPPTRYVESPLRPLPRQVEQLMPLSEPRVSSRASMRPVRDDQDLRRVASLHNMRSEATRDYVEPYYESPLRARAASYARTGSPALMESPRQPRDIPIEYDQPPQEVRVMRTPAPVYREVYDDGEGGYRYAAEPMPPPPPPMERIVVDQYGRKFREIIAPERPSVAPRAMSVRRGEPEPLYESYQSPRASSVFVDSGPERSYAAEMPPPQITYRRLGEPGRSSAVPVSATREYHDPSQLARPSSVQVVDRASRQPVYADDRAEFREPIRMSSVRPVASRYEESRPVEMLTRGQSVRPAAREGSVFVDDRPRVHQEYLPIEQPRYRAVEPEKRFFDAQGREVIMPMMDTLVDAPMDGRHRVMERY